MKAAARSGPHTGGVLRGELAGRMPGWIPAVVVAALTAAAFVLRFYRLGAMPLFGDEAYYLLWSERLAPAYVDHPAGIALALKLSTLLAGQSELGVRWLSALLSTACVPVAYAVGRRYVSAWGGLIAAAAVAFAPVYVITGRVAYPDAMQAFLMLVNLLALAPLILEDHGGGGPDRMRDMPGRRKRASLWAWAWFGATLALLLNIKLSSCFYATALVVYLMIRRRDLLREPGLWLAALIAGAGMIPFLAWNAAHDWATVRWAIFHGQGFGLERKNLPASLRHAAGYLSPGAVLLVAMIASIAAVCAWWCLRGGVAAADGSAEQAAGRNREGPILLGIVAAFLILPLILSAADSPRNLGLGLLAVWPLAGLPVAPGGGERRPAARRVARLGQALLCVLIAVYGAGTAAALLGPTRLPHNLIADAIRWDAAAWPEFAAALRLPAGSALFAVDYSAAGQVSRYTGRPVYSSEGQYRLWGVPEFESLTVLSTGFIPPEVITRHLRDDFAAVSGPEVWRYAADGLNKDISIWQASGRRAPLPQVLDDLDYLNLARESAIPLH